MNHDRNIIAWRGYCLPSYDVQYLAFQASILLKILIYLSNLLLLIFAQIHP